MCEGSVGSRPRSRAIDIFVLMALLCWRSCNEEFILGTARGVQSVARRINIRIKEDVRVIKNDKDDVNGAY